MYEPLKDLSSELFLPNIQLIENDTITLLETNQKFIEAYMAGLNHEFSRELLWREYPTDQRGSYFRQFWDASGFLVQGGASEEETRERLRDITKLHTWTPTDTLDDHDNREAHGDKEEELVLVIRGELLKKYPNAIIYAHRAEWERVGDVPTGAIDKTRPRRLRVLTAQEEASELRRYVKTPLYDAAVAPDIYFFGFDLTATEVLNGVDPKRPGEEGPGWFFVIKERPGEPRFGLDIAGAAPQASITTWNQLAWSDVGVAARRIAACRRRARVHADRARDRRAATELQKQYPGGFALPLARGHRLGRARLHPLPGARADGRARGRNAAEGKLMPGFDDTRKELAGWRAEREQTHERAAAGARSGQARQARRRRTRCASSSRPPSRSMPVAPGLWEAFGEFARPEGRAAPPAGSPSDSAVPAAAGNAVQDGRRPGAAVGARLSRPVSGRVVRGGADRGRKRGTRRCSGPASGGPAASMPRSARRGATWRGRTAWAVRAGSSSITRRCNPADQPQRNKPSDVLLVIVAAADAPAKTAEFWEKVWRAGGTEAAIVAARPALETAVGAATAKRIVEEFTPVNLGQPPGAGETRATNGVKVAVIKFTPLADLELRRTSWSRAPRVRLLPERLVLTAWRGKTTRDRGGGRSSSRRRSPSARIRARTGNEQLKPDGDDLQIPDSIRWMFDFERALEVGMAFRINLTPQQADVRLHTHRGARRARVGYAGRREEGARERCSRITCTAAPASSCCRRERRPTTPRTTAPASTCTATRTRRSTPASASSQAFTAGGRSAAAPRRRVVRAAAGDFAGARRSAIPNAGGRDQLEARAMNLALWPGTIGYMMRTMLAPVFADADIDATRSFFARYVSGRGPIPAVRVGCAAVRHPAGDVVRRGQLVRRRQVLERGGVPRQGCRWLPEAPACAADADRAGLGRAAVEGELRRQERRRRGSAPGAAGRARPASPHRWSSIR